MLHACRVAKRFVFASALAPSDHRLVQAQRAVQQSALSPGSLRSSTLLGPSRISAGRAHPRHTELRTWAIVSDELLSRCTSVWHTSTYTTVVQVRRGFDVLLSRSPWRCPPASSYHIGSKLTTGQTDGRRKEGSVCVREE